MKIKELFTDETKWTKGAFARAANGNPIGPMEDNAVCWCLLGAVRKCYFYSDLGDEIYTKLSIKLFTNPVSWNDTHTFEEVKELVERLDI